MDKLECISAEESRARLRIAYRQSGDETFVETLQRPFLNPVEQRNAKGKRNLHPLFVVCAVLLLLAGATIACFDFRIPGL
ncbi:MAG TPA: hypothetical protein VJS11_11065 [Acidobacteriaceae bacterium]|nr:hypothetical protein [Acidobacteriaceae bacterium]